MLQLAACHLGVYLCRGDVRVTENLAHGLNRHTIFKGQDCKRVPTYVVRDSLLDATHCSHFLDALVDGVKPADTEQVAVLSQWLIVLNNRNHLYFHTPSEPPLFKGDSRDVKNKK